MTIREQVNRARLFTGRDYTYDLKESRHTIFLDGSEVICSPLKEVIIEWLESVVLTSEVKQKRLNVNVPIGLHNACSQKARDQGSNLSEVLTTLMLNYIYK